MPEARPAGDGGPGCAGGGARTAGAPAPWRPEPVPGPDPSPPLAALDELLARAWQARQEHFEPDMVFARPHGTVPVSLTGSACDLGCDHCSGHYLQHMADLDALETRLRPTGPAGAGRPPAGGATTSFLVSGGCVAATGQVPFMSHLPRLHRLRAHGKLNFHVGLVGEAEAAALAGLADCVSFDVVGDDSTIREVLHLDRRVRDYAASLEALARHVRVIPHILIGLHGGELRGEWRALDLAASVAPELIVFIVFIPTKGTPLADRSPPPAEEVARFMAHARLRWPRTALGLGCMRPGGSYRSRLDPLAVRAGLQSIVLPAPEAVRTAAGSGLSIRWSTECCVL